MGRTIDRHLLSYAFCLVPFALMIAPRLQAQQTPSASISGVVVTDDETSRPIGRAMVTLNGAALRPNLMVVADDAGRFVFAGLPAGTFTVTASKPPYLTMSYGQTVAGRGSGVPIALEAGQQIADIAIKLTRGAVITGRVVDDRGQPVRHAPISILEYRMLNGERTLWSLGSQWPPTDANGMYRAYGLAPGNYLVSAYTPGDYLYFPGASQGPLTPSGGSTGAELRQVSAAEMQWAAQQLRAAAPRGAGALSAAPASPEPPAGPTVAYVATYFPGTTEPATAIAVTVGRGEERSGIDFAMQRQPTARISGRVVGSDGQPATNVRMESTGMGGGTMGWTSADGNFSLATLLPGQYRITARAANSATWATNQVSLNGQDVSDLVLTLQPSMTLSGRVVFEATSLAPPADVTAVRLSLRTAQGGPLVTTLQTPAAQSAVRADGTFQLAGLAPGQYRLTATLPNPAAAPGPPPASSSDASARWTIKSVMVGSRDAVDLPFEIQANESISGIAVTFTDRATELSGTLSNAAGRPAPGYYVVVFSQDKAFWVQGARRLPAPVRSATDGRFRFTELPPGPYYLAALTDMNLSDLADAAFLTQLTTSAIRVTLAEGERKVQDLTLARR